MTYSTDFFQVLYNVTMFLIISWRSCLFSTLGKKFFFKTRIVHFCPGATWGQENCTFLLYLAQTKPAVLLFQLFPPTLPCPGQLWSWCQASELSSEKKWVRWALILHQRNGEHIANGSVASSISFHDKLVFLPWGQTWVTVILPQPPPRQRGSRSWKKRNKRHSFIHSVYLSFLQHTFIEFSDFKLR